VQSRAESGDPLTAQLRFFSEVGAIRSQALIRESWLAAEESLNGLLVGWHYDGLRDLPLALVGLLGGSLVQPLSNFRQCGSHDLLSRFY
jgi:hypothetical protein